MTTKRKGVALTPAAHEAASRLADDYNQVQQTMIERILIWLNNQPVAVQKDALGLHGRMRPADRLAVLRLLLNSEEAAQEPGYEGVDKPTPPKPGSESADVPPPRRMQSPPQPQPPATDAPKKGRNQS